MEMRIDRGPGLYLEASEVPGFYIWWLKELSSP